MRVRFLPGRFELDEGPGELDGPDKLDGPDEVNRPDKLDGSDELHIPEELGGSDGQDNPNRPIRTDNLEGRDGPDGM